jgi:hypothetical protein
VTDALVVSFDLPDDESPEPGAPVRIEHGCDSMRGDDGTIEYHYNFLIYTWRVGEREIAGRTYLDTVHEVSVFVAASQLREDPALRPLVRYLQRRYRYLRSFHAEDAGGGGTGYTLVYQAAGAPPHAG